MSQSHHTMEYSCSHDPSHPDHLICIEHAQKLRRKEKSDASCASIFIGVPRTSNVITFLKKRYDTFYHPRHPRFILHRSVDAILAICILGLLTASIYLQFAGPFSFSKTSFLFSLVSERIVSGDISTLSLLIRNTSGERIDNPVLIFSLPEHFTLLDSSLNTPIKDRISLLEPLNKKEVRTVTIKGIAVGEPHEKQNISVMLQGKTLKDDFFQSDIQTLSYSISNSALDIIDETPKNLVAGSPFNAVVRVVNNASIPIENIRVLFTIPNGITLNFQKPDSKDFIIPKLDAHEEYRIPIHENIATDAHKDISVDTTLMQLYEGSSVMQRKVSRSLPYTQPALHINLELTPSGVSLKPGVPTRFSLHWKNESNYSISDVQLGVQTRGFGISDTSLSSDTALHKKQSGLLWTKNQIGELRMMKPGTSGSIIFSVTPSRDHVIRGLESNAPLDGVLHSYGVYVAEGTPYEISGNQLEEPIDTVVSLRASLRYFTPEGDQIGRGPWPPKAGKTTICYLFIDTSSSIHAIENARFSAHHSTEVSISTNVPVQYGEYTYDHAHANAVWNIGTMPAILAQPDSQTSSILQLTYTPSKQPADTAVIVGNMELRGIDAVTRAPIFIAIPDILFSQITEK